MKKLVLLLLLVLPGLAIPIFTQLFVDSLLVEAGSGVATLGIPGTPGITPGAAGDTVVVSYNALDQVEAAMKRWPGQIAAIIVEPVAGNMGVVPPSPGFLAGLRQLTKNDGSLLIFDEVITGFRVAPGGAQELYGVRPDLTCLGKVLGGGLPIGAYGGGRAIMEQVAPAGPVYQAGTLSGNPLAVAAGLATLGALDDSAYRNDLQQVRPFDDDGESRNREREHREPARPDGELQGRFLERAPTGHRHRHCGHPPAQMLLSAAHSCGASNAVMGDGSGTRSIAAARSWATG